ncbi:isocitrate lyase/phosphoenolpyruvate mutase family protein [Propioniciclava sp. MC1595]|nr:isocitrate lyase/phosphoenolpyruvate mutase family protein [Propioniciclava sp. MC1595]MBB1494405.1 isocitrate lyase/phosphoenolpyruvate mutase family protein [Propioniciclava sp. MC1595]QTE27223.1 isocitrate lyase/phosphoenolpyruvate mutase family protein [Propioniciclava sp. MC1595]
MSFLDRHRPGDPLVAPNAWDLGSARALASLGFAALGTTSSGLGVAHGVRDGAVGCDAMLANARAMAEATGWPVTVDLEDGYAPDPEGVRDTFGGPARSGWPGRPSRTGTAPASAAWPRRPSVWPRRSRPAATRWC